MGGLLVSCEAALALVLLVGAGLLIRSFGNLTEEVSVPTDRYGTMESRAAFYLDWVESLSEIGAITAVGGVNNMPFLYQSCDGFRLEDRTQPPPGERPCAYNQLVTQGYFRAAGIAMVEGREFTAADRADSRLVIVVSAAFAERFWPGRSAVGEHVSYNGVSREIVGVSAAVRRLGLEQAAPAEMFIPRGQAGFDPRLFIVVRSTAGSDESVRLVRASLAQADGDVVVGRILSLEQFVSSTVAAPRFRTLALSLFALLALVLAAVGVYGVMAHSVSMRSRELGIRIALGADRSGVRRLVLLDGLRRAGTGLAIGWVAALWAGRLLEGLLHEVKATDWVSLAGATTVLLLAGLLASYVPARRATGADPLIVLRYD